jgi:hypothetical protein
VREDYSPSFAHVKNFFRASLAVVLYRLRVLAGAGAKLTREVFFNLWKYSSLFPGNGARKLA